MLTGTSGLAIIAIIAGTIAAACCFVRGAFPTSDEPGSDHPEAFRTTDGSVPDGGSNSVKCVNHAASAN